MNLFAIHNNTRGRENKTARYAAPTHRGMVQWVGKKQERVVRSRPLIWTETQILENLEELKQKVALGLLAVKTTDGRRVDLDTLQVAPIAPSAPLPNPPLDSAANDSPHVGEHMPQFQGGIPEMGASVSPEELGIPAEFLGGSTEEASAEVDFKPHQGKKGRR